MHRDAGRCAGAANRRLACEIIACVAMLEDPGEALLAQSAFASTRGHDLGEVSAAAPALPACPAARGSQCVSLRSETVDRGTGCGSSAGPDLWEPRVGNHPRPPSPPCTTLPV